MWRITIVAHLITNKLSQVVENKCGQKNITKSEEWDYVSLIIVQDSKMVLLNKTEE